MNILLKPFQDQNQLQQNKSIVNWEAVNLTTTELTIQVNFTDPSLISPKISQEDEIEISFKEGDLIKSTNGLRSLPDNYVLITGLPRQVFLSKKIATIQDMISGGSKTMTYLVIGNIALQLFLSFSMHLIWGMMNNLQLISIMLKFNINVPSNAYIFYKYLDEFLSMKAQFIENYLEKFNSYIMKTTTSAESDRDSNSSIIKNLGTIILGSVALVVAMILTAILIKYSHNPLVIKITDGLKNKLFYNSLLRAGVQSYLKLSIIAFASLETHKNISTIATGIAFLLITVFFIVFAHFFLCKNLTNLSDPQFQQKFNSLYLNIDTDIRYSYFLTTIFLLRRFLIGIILSYCDEHQEAQFFYMNFSSFLIIVYLFKVRPLVSSYLNTIEIFNEVILYGCTGLIWGMTDYQSEKPLGKTAEQINSEYNSKQEHIGWAYIIMGSLTIAVTIGGIIINFLGMIKDKIKQKFANKALKAPEAKQQSPRRREDYKIQQQDGSTMNQNMSNLEDQIVQNNNNLIKEHQQIQDREKFQNHNNLNSQKMSEEEYYDEEVEEIKLESSLKTPFNAQRVPPSNPPIIHEDEKKYTESVFVSSSEFQSSFEEIKETFRVILAESPHQEPQPPKIFVSSEEIQNIFKDSAQSLTPNDLWEENNNFERRKVIIKGFR